MDLVGNQVRPSNTASRSTDTFGTRPRPQNDYGKPLPSPTRRNVGDLSGRPRNNGGSERGAATPSEEEEEEDSDDYPYSDSDLETERAPHGVRPDH